MIYLIEVVAMILSVSVCLAILVNFIKHLMPSAHEIKYEVIFYKRFGLGILEQFFIRIALLMLVSVMLFCILSIISWSWHPKYLLLGAVLCMFLLMIRMFSVLLNVGAVYYLGILFIIISVFYPMYILPNTAYIVKTGSYDIAVYLFTYWLLYFFIAFKIFGLKWREECLGWI